jgi:hypothetical protein
LLAFLGVCEKVMKQYLLFIMLLSWAAYVSILMAVSSVVEANDAHLSGTGIDGGGQRRRQLIKARRAKMAKRWKKRVLAGETLDDIFNCVGNPDPSRWRHEEPLHRNQYLCSKSDDFVFGLTNRGELIWVDVKTAKTKKYFRITSSMRQSGVKPEYFQLSRYGELQLYDKQDYLLWKQPPNADDIDVNHSCLTDYSCPYLHLHANQGKNVLNYIDPQTDSWITEGMDKAYDFE